MTLLNNNNQFFFIGHRGTRVGFDENTIEAFQIAIDSGANYIEFDVRATKDKKIIIFHDEKLNRITNLSGAIKDFNLEEIKTFKTKITGSKIPLLSEIFEIFKNKINFMIHLKQAELMKDVIKMIKTKDLTKNCVISERKLSVLKMIHHHDHQIKTCYNITHGKDLSLQEFLKKGEKKKLPFRPTLINLKSDLITKRFINLCHENEILALSWDFLNTQHPLKKIIELIEMKIDGILFDNYKNITIIKKWLKEKKI
ncbi:MAG: glycerophosphodiester phosphodiesterase [Promethearchaeota archaeon]